MTLRKKIPLMDWARVRYSPVPPLSTLRRWARTGQFSPPAERTGKHYYVREDAVLVGTTRHDTTPLVDRI